MKFFLIYFIILCHFSFAAEDDNGLFLPSHSVSKEPVIPTIKPQQVGYNSSSQTFIYVPEAIYEVTFFYEYVASIEFEDDEAVSKIIAPPEQLLLWQMQPLMNRLYVRPIASNANIFLNIITNKREYKLKFLAEEPIRGKFEPRYTNAYKFHYPNYDDAQNIKTYTHSLLPDIDQNPGKYNFNYTITGEDTFYPVKVFDNGEFTFFEFPKHAALPAIFSVDSSNFESIINYKIEGPYIVIEEVGARFSLRNGGDVVCVFNEEKTSRLRLSKQHQGFYDKRKQYNLPKDKMQ